VHKLDSRNEVVRRIQFSNGQLPVFASSEDFRPTAEKDNFEQDLSFAVTGAASFNSLSNFITFIILTHTLFLYPLRRARQGVYLGSDDSRGG